MGLTPERFGQMLESQGCTCAMCRTPFEEDQRICIDHDHACCPPKLPSRCCGSRVRGLLCLTCNIALGYIETYSDLAVTYLSQRTALRPASPPTGRALRACGLTRW